MTFKIVDARDERELEDLIVKSPHAIEDGLRVLGRQIRTDVGPLDILAVDNNGVILIIELKAGNADEWVLTQVLSYYDWVFENTAALAQFYPDVKINIGVSPRIILVARTFSDILTRIVRHATPNISLRTYTCLETDLNKKGVIVSELPVPPLRTPPQEPPKIQDHINWIQDPSVRQAFVQTIDRIKDIGDNITVYPTQGYIAVRAESNFAWLHTRTAFFYFQIGDEFYRIEKSDDVAQEIWDKFKSEFVKYGGKIREKSQ